MLLKVLEMSLIEHALKRFIDSGIILHKTILRHSKSTCNNGMWSVEKIMPKSWRQYTPGIR